MTRILLTSATIAALAFPTFAQETEEDDGPSLMEQGFQMLMEEFLSEMEPALKDLEGMADELGPSLRSFAEEMGPALVDLLGKIEDFSAYHAPEILPNGDIIIRRKTPAEKAEDKSEEDIEI